MVVLVRAGLAAGLLPDGGARQEVVGHVLILGAGGVLGSSHALLRGELGRNHGVEMPRDGLPAELLVVADVLEHGAAQHRPASGYLAQRRSPSTTRSACVRAFVSPPPCCGPLGVPAAALCLTPARRR
eukprot:Tamp_16982.p2 GENE.Tamp_16982~~Tamp_16982.p2  ORF type:complete len:128 (+),score=7.44 Tamp_16982:817-1200(+)